MNYQLLIHLDDKHPPITQNLHLATYVLGRNSTCNILILDQYISRWHCTLVLMPPTKTNPIPYYLIVDGLLLSETKSTGGTWVNGHKVNSAKLNDKDTITFGSRPYPKAMFIAENPEMKSFHEDVTFPVGSEQASTDI